MENTWLIEKDEIEHYHQHGYLIKKNVFSFKEIEQWKKSFYKLWLKNLAKGHIIQNRKFPFQSLFPPLQEANRSDPSIEAMVLNPKNFSLCESLLGEEALIVGTTCFYKAPGEKQQPFHQDNFDMGVLGAGTCGLWISIDSSSSGNGGLCIIPRTHQIGLLSLNSSYTDKWGLLELPVNDTSKTTLDKNGYEMIEVETEPGDVVLFNGNTVHGSFANQTKDSFRMALAIHFTGVSATKVFGHFNSLLNKNGEKVVRKLNKQHSKIRTLLVPESKYDFSLNELIMK